MSSNPATQSHLTKAPITWSSRFAFIMASTGAAVGLGNIWKFPYMAGENGGGAFVCLYLLAILLIGIPTMIAEILIGRLGQANPIDSFRLLAKKYHKSPAWQLIGWWGALGLTLVLSFYSVIAGWSLAYLYKAITGSLNHLHAGQIQDIWVDFLSSPLSLVLWHTFFMFITLAVVAKGVQAGIERISKIMMPLLFIILVILMLYSCFTGNFTAAWNFLVIPDFAKITPSVIIYALGHAFFTLAIGAGAMLVYGSYLPPKTKIAQSVCIIAGLDVLVALLAGFAIFPLVFGHNLSPEAGPGLMFKVLPIAFSYMPLGPVIGSLFFILLWFAAWSSTLSMAEPLVMLLMERMHLKRHTASWIVGSVCWLAGVAAALSFNVWHSIKIFHKFTIFDAMADLTTNILLPLGGLAFVIFAGWKIPMAISREELSIKRPIILFYVWRFLVRYIAPLGIMVIFFWNLWY